MSRNKQSLYFKGVQTRQILSSNHGSDVAQFVLRVSNDSNPKYLNIMATKLISKYSAKNMINICKTLFETLDSSGIADSYTHTALMTAFIR